MTNLQHHQNVWIPATEMDKMGALASLAGLPSRQTSSEDLDRAAYYVALDGVTRHGLAEAVRFILKGSLGHAFMPSPPELRIQCDKAMQWHHDEAERIRRREQIARDRLPPVPPRSEAEIARNKARVAELYRSMGWTTDENDSEAFQSAMETKYGAAALAAIPDNPRARERMNPRTASE